MHDEDILASASEDELDSVGREPVAKKCHSPIKTSSFYGGMSRVKPSKRKPLESCIDNEENVPKKRKKPVSKVVTSKNEKVKTKGDGTAGKRNPRATKKPTKYFGMETSSDEDKSPFKKSVSKNDSGSEFKSLPSIPRPPLIDNQNTYVAKPSVPKKATKIKEVLVTDEPEMDKLVMPEPELFASPIKSTPEIKRKFFTSSRKKDKNLAAVHKVDGRLGYQLSFAYSESPVTPKTVRKPQIPKASTPASIVNTPKGLLKQPTPNSGMKRTPRRVSFFEDIRQSDKLDVTVAEHAIVDMENLSIQCNDSFFNEAIDDSADNIDFTSFRDKPHQSARDKKLQQSTNAGGDAKETNEVTDTSESPSRKLFPIFEKRSSPKTPSNEKSSGDKPKSRRRLPFLKATEQYAIDAGQMNFDGFTCKTCHMVYTPGEVTDETHHGEYHDTFVNGVKFPGWKKENVVKRISNGSRIIAVHPTDKKYMLKKVDDLLTVADLELGIGVGVEQCMKNTSMFLLYVSSDKRVAGFVAAEAIYEANRLVCEDPLSVSLTSYPARAGIARIWVHPNYRRKGVATEMLEALRVNFKIDRILRREEIAFSDPTNEGIAFAKTFTGTSNFLIFQYQPITNSQSSQLNSVAADY
ncbi:N-acetyltransferase ESCO1 [Halotydeus destructor]|nr:N-acetyltransferase ESCO1 [Halotydeus destructor]